MNFFKKIFLMGYMLIMLLIGVVLVLISIDIIPADQVTSVIFSIRSSVNYQIVVWCFAAIFFLIGLILPYRGVVALNKGRMLTFQNADGEVSVSIAAIEDFVKKVAKDIPDITNVKSRVVFNRKGINIRSDVTINAGANIPEVTEQIQLEVRNKIQSMLGVEEKINVSMHVSKIIGKVPHEVPQQQEDPETSNIPFRQYVDIKKGNA